MSGFDLPPILGFDRSFQRPQGPLPGLEGFQGPGRAFGPGRVGEIGEGVDRIAPGARAPGDAPPFSGVFADSLDQVKGLQDEAKAKVEGLVMGEDVELHDVMIASSKSQVAFNLMLEVRNKLVDAWEKLSRSTV